MVGLKQGLVVATTTTLALLPSATAELNACLAALSQLNAAPYNASLPIMNGVTGE